MDDSNIPLKRCVKCSNEYPATSEYFYTRTNLRLFSSCKTCEKQRQSEYYGNNKDKYREYYQENRDWIYVERKDQIADRAKKWAKAHPEYRRARRRKRRAKERQTEGFKRRAREYAKRYKIRHKEKVDARNRAYRERNREKINERARSYSKVYSQKNPDIHKVKNEKRRARKLSKPNSFKIHDWMYALKYWDNRCAYCGNQRGLFYSMRLTMDHYIPLSNSDNPGTVPKNILPACQSCNSQKHDRNAFEWLCEKIGISKAKRKIEEIEVYFRSVSNNEKTS